MTILLMEGFDLYNGTDATTGIAANWLLDNYYATLSTPAGRFGGKCFCTVWGGSVQYSLAYRTLAAQTSAFSFGLAIRISDFSDRRSCGCSARRAYQACIRTDSFGNLIACRASSRTSQTDLGKTSAPVLRRNAALCRGRRRDRRYRGDADLCRRGQSARSSGVDTQQQATSQIGMIQLGYTGSSATYYFDDLYVTTPITAWASARSPCSPPPPMWQGLHPVDRHRQLCLPRRCRARHHRLCDRLGAGPPTPTNCPIWSTPRP
jgi:hypothetical protein